MVELVEPIFILEDAAKDALVVTKEYKGKETDSGDCELEGFLRPTRAPLLVSGDCNRFEL